jgi:hypothetical protein
MAYELLHSDGRYTYVPYESLVSHTLRKAVHRLGLFDIVFVGKTQVTRLA